MHIFNKWSILSEQNKGNASKTAQISPQNPACSINPRILNLQLNWDAELVTFNSD